MIIINADDFGASESINRAIVDSFKRGYISSTTIMVNMPAFSEACELIQKHHLNGHVGIHLVLTTGMPVTDRIKENRHFCDENGLFMKRKKNPLYFLNDEDKACIAWEFQKQIDMCRDYNISITHIDSHHHIHTDFQILRIVRQLAERNGIKYIRNAKNVGKLSFPRKIYNQQINIKYKKDGVFKADYFGSSDDFRNVNFDRKRVYEIMVHPNYLNGQIVDLDKTPLPDKLKVLRIDEEILSYRNHSYRNRLDE